MVRLGYLLQLVMGFAATKFNKRKVSPGQLLGLYLKLQASEGFSCLIAADECLPISPTNRLLPRLKQIMPSPFCLPPARNFSEGKLGRTLQFRYKPERDSASDIQNVLLVVVALVAVATFQAGIDTPGGVQQEITSTVNGVTRHAGSAILSSKPGNCKLFFFCNTLAYSSSIDVISYLVYRFPFYREIWVALLSFSATYGAAIGSLNPRGAVCLVYASVAFFVPPGQTKEVSKSIRFLKL